MMEHGLNKFYASISAFIRNLRDENNLNDKPDDFKAVTMEQFMFSLAVCGCIICLAGIVLLIEFIVHKYKILKQKRLAAKRRNQLKQLITNRRKHN